MGEWDGNFVEENQDFKLWKWGRISSCRELYTPLGRNVSFLCESAWKNADVGEALQHGQEQVSVLTPKHSHVDPDLVGGSMDPG